VKVLNNFKTVTVGEEVSECTIEGTAVGMRDEGFAVGFVVVDLAEGLDGTDDDGFAVGEDVGFVVGVEAANLVGIKVGDMDEGFEDGDLEEDVGFAVGMLDEGFAVGMEVVFVEGIEDIGFPVGTAVGFPVGN